MPSKIRIRFIHQDHVPRGDDIIVFEKIYSIEDLPILSVFKINNSIQLFVYETTIKTYIKDIFYLIDPFGFDYIINIVEHESVLKQCQSQQNQ